jgi:hypothetical protein
MLTKVKSKSNQSTTDQAATKALFLHFLPRGMHSEPLKAASTTSGIRAKCEGDNDAWQAADSEGALVQLSKQTLTSQRLKRPSGVSRNARPKSRVDFATKN